MWVPGFLVDQLRQGLAGVGGERGDVDQRLDVVHAAGGVADDRAAVGVADQHDRAVDGLQDTADVVGV